MVEAMVAIDETITIVLDPPGAVQVEHPHLDLVLEVAVVRTRHPVEYNLNHIFGCT